MGIITWMHPTHGFFFLLLVPFFFGSRVGVWGGLGVLGLCVCVANSTCVLQVTGDKNPLLKSRVF